METPDGFGGFRKERQLIRIVKFADDLLIWAKGKGGATGSDLRLAATGRGFGVEINP